jgi:hypothetical protein
MSRNGKVNLPQDTIPNGASMESAVQFVLSNVPKSQLLEMYYWTQEEDILRIVRGLITLPMQTRQELMFFLDRVQQQPAVESQVEDDDEFASADDGKTYLLPH